MCQCRGASHVLKPIAPCIKVQLSCPVRTQVAAWGADLQPATACTPIPFFARLLYFSRTSRGCFCGGGCLFLCINCRLGKLTRGNLLTCLIVLRKVLSKRSQAVDAYVCRGLDGWACACVPFTEQLRAPQASLMRDRVRFVLLNAHTAPRLVVQVRPVLQFCTAWGNHMRPLIRRQVVSNLKVLGRSGTSSANSCKTCGTLRAH